MPAHKKGEPCPLDARSMTLRVWSNQEGYQLGEYEIPASGAVRVREIGLREARKRGVSDEALRAAIADSRCEIQFFDSGTLLRKLPDCLKVAAGPRTRVVALGVRETLGGTLVVGDDQDEQS